MKISNNTVLITGGATGIGFALAELFLENKNTVIICGRRTEKLQAAKEKLPALVTIQCDVSHKEERARLFNDALKSYPELNVLINNAGVQRLLTLDKLAGDLESIESEIATNLTAPIHLSGLFRKHLSGKKEAAIINITSGLGYTPIAEYPVYCATKAALHSFSLTLRHLLKDTGIKVFEIIPPIVNTDLKGEGVRIPGGISPEETAAETMKALESDNLEFPIGQAVNLYNKREQLFSVLNR
jgi:uncharacterized oxidoreductase